MNVISDSIVLAQHLQVTVLRVLGSKLTTSLRVLKKCVDIFEINVWDMLALKTFEPSILHYFSDGHAYSVDLIRLSLSIQRSNELFERFFRVESDG